MLQNIFIYLMTLISANNENTCQMKEYLTQGPYLAYSRAPLLQGNNVDAL